MPSKVSRAAKVAAARPRAELEPFDGLLSIALLGNQDFKLVSRL
jgi:hypothetical protein